MSETSYKLDELAKAAGTSPRTVRYYVQRGLLPPPVFRGKDSAYGREHLARLRAIRRLQADYLPLDAIASELEGRSIAEIERLSEEHAEEHAPRRAPAPPSLAREAERWRRTALARGLELHVAEDAPAEAKALAERILNLISSLREGA